MTSAIPERTMLVHRKASNLFLEGALEKTVSADKIALLFIYFSTIFSASARIFDSDCSPESFKKNIAWDIKSELQFFNMTTL